MSCFDSNVSWLLRWVLIKKRQHVDNPFMKIYWKKSEFQM